MPIFQMLACNDLGVECVRVLKLFARYLRSQCTVMRQLVLRGLTTLSKTPYTVSRVQLAEHTTLVVWLWARDAG